MAKHLLRISTSYFRSKYKIRYNRNPVNTQSSAQPESPTEATPPVETFPKEPHNTSFGPPRPRKRTGLQEKDDENELSLFGGAIAFNFGRPQTAGSRGVQQQGKCNRKRFLKLKYLGFTNHPECSHCWCSPAESKVSYSVLCRFPFF